MSSRIRILSLCLIATAAAGAAPQAKAAANAVTAEDYARAERFLPGNAARYAVNGEIQHYWIGNEDRFWYLRTDSSGDKAFIVVEAASGKRMPAFDQQAIAAALSTATGTQIAAGKLPFSNFHYVQNKSAIQFLFKDAQWNCQLQPTSCSTVQPAFKATESVSPDGKWAVFVRDHNLWARAGGSEESFPLTTDGVEHYDYASPPESNLHRVTDLRHPKPKQPIVLWSPDSRYVLTQRVDERKVKDLFLIQSVPEDGSMRPKLYTYRYPMPGDEHVTQAEPVVFDVAARRQIKFATPPLICTSMTAIEKRDTWWSADSKSVYYLKKDRFLKSISLIKANPATGAVQEIVQESSPTVMQLSAGSVLDLPAVRTLGNGDVIWYSRRDGWGHLYYYNGKTGALRNPITGGNWIVRRIVRVDEPRKRVYFKGSGREAGRDPYEQRLYSVQFDGSGLRVLTPEESEHELPYVPSAFNPDADPLSSETEKEQFSPSGRYFIDSYSRPEKPPVFVVRSADGRLIGKLEEADISKLRAGGYVPPEPFRVLAADGKTEIYGNLFRPSTFDPTKKYPVIDANYPGPQVSRTGKSFIAANFHPFEAQSLAELGFIVITIDGRGTTFRSKAFQDYSYGKMGKASELEDHIAGIRQLAQRHSFIDIDRVGVDGVSGGGFAAAHAIFSYPDFYKVAVSAEGNHDQRGYTATWGELYIGPLDKSDYLDASNPHLAANLKGKLMLMHGEMDDNVSPALTMKVVDALIKANKDFDLLIVPNENHGAFYTSPYFIRRKWDYFVRNLAGAEPPAHYSISLAQ